MNMTTALPATLAFILLSVFSTLSSASDGRIEINQASVEDAGGFPFTINEPGSYVLTGSLVVPAGTDGLILGAANISIDLNGFSIESSSSCPPDTCIAGAGEGIRRLSDLLGHGQQAMVHNGRVVGFANHCIRLGNYAQVSDLTILHCGQNGILVGRRSIVSRNTVSNTGLEALSIPADGIYSHNTLSRAGLAGGGEPTVSGGTATAGNFCDDGNCGWVDTRRRFYITFDSFSGGAALDACDAGFHMASMWELLDVTQLRFDAARSYGAGDRGEGPPNVFSGWIRTGQFAGSSSTPGQANCFAWDSAMDTHSGTYANLQDAWHPSDFSPGRDSRISGWYTGTSTCDTPRRVWCVED